jgi:hypothetical protein
MVKHLFAEATVPVPRTAPVLCDCVVLPSLELSHQGGATAAGAEALHAVAAKSVKKNILRSSTEPFFSDELFTPGKRFHG